MKKTITAVLLLITLNCVAQKAKADTLYEVKYSVTEWDNILKWLDIAKSEMKKTNMPSYVMVQITDSLTAFQLRWIEQIKSQLKK